MSYLDSLQLAPFLVLFGSLLFLTIILMPDRHPHHKLIKEWASCFDLKIKYTNRYRETFEVDIIDNIMWISKYNKAVHDGSEYLYSVAHEFGHIIDHGYREYYNKYSKNPLKAQAILEEEKRAWKIARVLLKDTSAYDQKIFNKLRRRSLNQYKAALGL